MAYSPDGTHIVSVSEDRTARTWHVETCWEQVKFTSGGSFLSVAYSPDGRLIAAGGYDSSVFVWNSQTGMLVARLHPNQVSPGRAHSDIFKVNFDAEGGRIFASRGGSTVLVWHYEESPFTLDSRGVTYRGHKVRR